MIPAGILASSVKVAAFASSFLQATNAGTSDGFGALTASSVNLGAAATDRVIVIAVLPQTSNTFVYTRTVTIGGVTATSIYHSSGARPIEFFMATVPSGTSGSIVFTGTNPTTLHQVMVWRLTGGLSGTRNTGFSNGAGPGRTMTLTGYTGGIILCAQNSFGGIGTVSWTNATPRAVDPTYSAADDTAVGSTSITASGTSNNAAARRIAGVAFQP